MGENRGGAFGGDDIEVGYIDDDNFKDIMIMAYHWSSGRGRTYLYYGNKKAHLDTHFDNTFSGTIRDNFPFHATVGDFNKDGYGDLVVGGWRHNNYQGRAWLYYGGPGDSRQLKFDWKTGDASPGKHLLKATIEPIAGEQDVADNTMTVEVEVKESSK